MSEELGATARTGTEGEDVAPELTRAQKAEQAKALFAALPTPTKVKAITATVLTLVGATFVAKGGYKVVRAGIRRVRR